jgi:hypothetical protein
LEDYINQGINIDSVVIRNKGRGASRCPRCPTKKTFYRDYDDKLKKILPKIWKFIHLESLNDILYDSSNPNKQALCTTNKIQVAKNRAFSDLELVTGAEEI